MYKSILVPLVMDSDKNNAASLELAYHLLADGGTVTALHVMEELPGYVAEQLPEGQRAQQRKDLGKDLEEQVKGWPATKTKVVLGHAARSILDEANTLGSDCIVITSHTPGMQDYFLGSTAARVVRHAKCAVHVIR